MRIAKEKLDAVTTIVTHDNCTDGLAAAMILKDVYPKAEIIFCQHNTEPFEKLEVRPNMLFVDIIPPAARYKEFLEAGALVLDHHKGVREIIEAFGENSVFGDEKTQPGVSGATLAYLHVWKPITEAQYEALCLEDTEQDPIYEELNEREAKFVENFARLAGIRDTWQKLDPEWYAASRQGEFLYFYPREMWMETPLKELRRRWAEFEGIGDILMKKQADSISRVSKEVFQFTTKSGTRVVCLNHLRMSSDMAEHFGKDADLVISFSYKTQNGKPKLVCSSRSHTFYNCMALAQKYGGNGHTKAAGFSINVEPQHPNAFQMLKEIVELHEA
jgi:hypothetical protein